ncbi:MAG: sigma-70 family RNA polymerase sigma factor [Deltaproteobacteria bacterium]|nr:sigma-70 family RNA polymerase sigma factor [Deltaproteobacteria bacterium]
MLLLEDRKLLDRFRRGDRAALDAVYRAYARELASFLRNGFSFSSGGRACRFRGATSHFDLEDRLQETFGRAFAEPARMGYDGVSPYKAYLITIARNLVIDEFRRKERALTDCFAEVPEGPNEPVAASDPILGRAHASGRPDQDAESAELAGLVRGFRDGLPEREREIYRLRFEEELEHGDIARKTGLSPSKVKTSEKRIRTGFFELMRARGYFAGFEQTEGGWLRFVRGR